MKGFILFIIFGGIASNLIFEDTTECGFITWFKNRIITLIYHFFHVPHDGFITTMLQSFIPWTADVAFLIPQLIIPPFRMYNAKVIYDVFGIETEW
jgi:hypothetical protein